MIARFALAIAVSASCVAFAADKAAVSADDQKFIDNAARAGVAEVKAAQLAKEKGASQAVKDFARQMEEDHTQANEELEKLAKSKGARMPTEPDSKHKRMMDELRTHTAAQFDREYMKQQVDDHRSVVREFEREAKNGRDADLKKWANDKLPTLKHHLEMANATHKAVANESPKARKQPDRDTSGSMKR